MARVDGEFLARAVDVDAGATIVGSKGVPEHAGALVAEVVFAIVEGREPFAAFEEDDGQSGFGEFFGDYSASGTGADNHRVYVFQGHWTSGAKAPFIVRR